VPLCRNSSSKELQEERKRLGLEKLSFHSFPDTKSSRGKEWSIKIRRDIGPDFTINKSTRIYSAHFKLDDFIFTEYNIETERRHLKNTAVPSIFAWTTESCRATVTSQIARSSKNRCELTVPVNEFDMENYEDNFCSISDANVESDPEEIIEYPSDKVVKLTATIQQLQETITELSEMLQQAENDVKKSRFCYENIKDRDDLVKFYTGLPDHSTLLAFL